MSHIHLRAFLGLLFTAALTAQPQTGSLSGRVVGGDGFGLPGAVVTVSGPSLPATRNTMTNGNGDYAVSGLPAGDFTVTVRLEGFATAQRREVEVSLTRANRADFVLLLAEIVEEVIITATTNAATNLPPTLTDSEVPRGGIVNVWGFNVGPDQLVTNPDLPFAKTVGGYSMFVEAGGQRFDAFPLFVSKNQSAAILSSQTPTGEGHLFVEGNGRMSNPYRVNVVDHQPGIFTRRHDGHGAGIFTQLDYSLITPQNPATPGDTIIGWGTGWAPGQFDDRPGVFDKRDALDDFSYRLGGVEIPQDGVLYIGSGGSPGVDQWIGAIPAGSPLGCGVPFSAFHESADGKRILSNTVTLPITADGSPCGDPHGLPSEFLDSLREGPLTLASAVVTEFGIFDGNRSPICCRSRCRDTQRRPAPT